MKRFFSIFFLIFSTFSFSNDKLKIGVSLQAYYSFVSNIVKDRAEVIPVARLDLYDSHSYQPKIEDIKRVADLDVLVVNGIGHDEFMFEILNASDRKDKIKVIYANKDISLMPVAGTLNSQKILNTHTFISITTSIQQIYNIARELAEIDSKNKEFYLENAREYVKKLRKLKVEALDKIKDLDNFEFKVATFMGGYDYLFAEFGIDVKAVIEPFHGAQPSVADIKKAVDIIKAENIDVIFGEKHFSNKYVEAIQRETGIELRTLDHLTSGPYEIDSFEKLIKVDLEEIVDTIKYIAKKKNKI
ncbi:metal ABC transporter solute-binding protein, Zn/Mn family [Fusobacterium russii]|uniref:metal ABC transporter solute-binding protein, Zn/Mn family n=1 Tax=Fusobacterium russii TaxID=854 RepID=UPI0003A1F001|nr:zinc ABC transporter substrate-binding protein [Fusobacterium russii]